MLSGRKLVIVILANVQKDKYKNGKLPAKVDKEITWNKILVDLIYHTDFKHTYICYPRKGKKEY